MPSPASIVVDVCRLLEPTRVEIMLILASKSATSRELGETLGLSKQAVGRHIVVMKAWGVIEAERASGRSSIPIYLLTPKGRTIAKAIESIAGA